MKHIEETNLKLESEEQLKNCEDMHIWVQPIKEYIKKLEAKDKLLRLYRDYFYALPDEAKLLREDIEALEEELEEIE